MAIEPQSKKVYANGINIHYWDWGGDKSPIVMLHPSRGFGRMWDFVARCLHPYYRVLCLDQRGHGDTDKPDIDYAGEDYAADLDAFSRELGLETVILVGHSLGSGVGIIFAAQHPDRISHLIMVGGPHYISVVPSDLEEQESRKRRAQEQQIVQFRFGSVEEALESLRAPTSSYRSLSEEVLRHLVTYNMNHNRDGSLEWKWDSNAVAQTLSHIPDDLTPYLGHITCPVLIPWGKRSQDLTPERVPIVKPLFPTAQWVFLEEAEYYIYLEAPELLARNIREFLGR